ncbi:protein phosphatase 2C domain-containing protein [Virgisporangium aurantiacum]|uniref:PPM-type phosphatase domain-containing protein n=1 Tax=Virgisporangium aurantiacum TaxID=175570 RepID=A0A8J3ZKC5_9ACTN|nr:protein phosphatase 2C domain-containing protein [Virgisporangium aurantiacum]GIJ63540.1 hypothetical protein Vau01_110560 [Virgisporangium aurantiacum]
MTSSDPVWRGCSVPYVVGEEGAAAQRVVARPAVDFPEQRDIVVDGVTFHNDAGEPVAQVRAASIRGLSHRYYGKPRQDAYAFRATADGHWLVVAVADGVSAGAYSHMAAEIVTDVGCRLLAERGADQVDWDRLLRDLASWILARGRAVIVAEAELSDREVAEHMSATALFAVVALRPSESDARSVHCLAVGDTGAWILGPGQESPWRAVTGQKADEDGVASSATLALPLTVVAPTAAKAETLTPGTALVLVTDGIGDPLGDGTGEVGRFLATMWARPPSALEFAAQVDFARRSYDDDRTAVVVWVP